MWLDSSGMKTTVGLDSRSIDGGGGSRKSINKINIKSSCWPEAAEHVDDLLLFSARRRFDLMLRDLCRAHEVAP